MDVYAAGGEQALQRSAEKKFFRHSGRYAYDEDIHNEIGRCVLKKLPVAELLPVIRAGLEG